jgi:hypothetical protein
MIKTAFYASSIGEMNLAGQGEKKQGTWHYPDRTGDYRIEFFSEHWQSQMILNVKLSS